MLLVGLSFVAIPVVNAEERAVDVDYATIDAFLSTTRGTTHGYTSSWDRGGKTDNPPNGVSTYSTSTGYLMADSTKQAYAEAWLNSANVKATQAVTSVTVTLFFSNFGGWNAGGYEDITIKFYKNGYYVSEKSTSSGTVTYCSSYAQCTFSSSISYNDSLDVDIIFSAYSASAYGGTVHIEANIDYVSFTTD